MRVAAIVLALAMACAQQSSTPPPAATETAPPAAETQPVQSGPRVIFPNGYVVNVEIADDPELRAQGLMFRDQLAPGNGMLFFFTEDDVFTFWMKNTRIPLDMIWIDADKRVVHIKTDVPPCRVENCPSYEPGVKARYVLEVAGGESARRGFKVGDVLQFAGMDHVVAR